MAVLTYVKPAEGRMVLEPRTKMQMPPEGMFVLLSDPHWAAHLRFEDIVMASPPAPPLPAPPAPAPAPEPAQT